MKTLEFGLDTFLPVTVDGAGLPISGDQVIRNTVEEAVIAETVAAPPGSRLGDAVLSVSNAAMGVQISASRRRFDCAGGPWPIQVALTVI